MHPVYQAMTDTMHGWAQTESKTAQSVQTCLNDLYKYGYMESKVLIELQKERDLRLAAHMKRQRKYSEGPEISAEERRNEFAFHNYQFMFETHKVFLDSQLAENRHLQDLALAQMEYSTSLKTVWNHLDRVLVHIESEYPAYI